MIDKWQKAHIAQLKVEQRAVEKGAIVSRPSTDTRYDLIVDWSGRLYRAQVKYAGGVPRKSQGAFSAELRKEGKRYMQDEIDVLLVYVPAIDQVCWFGPEVFHNKTNIYIRIAPAKNGQKASCILAEEHIW